MTHLVGPSTFYTVAGIILAAVRQALADGPTTVPARTGVVPGMIAWDDCDCDGLLVISMSRSYFSENFPQEASAIPFGNCGAAWFGGDFTLQVARCIPVSRPDGSPPTPAMLDASAQSVMADMWTVIRTVNRTLCGMVDDTIIDYTIGANMTVGPSGGCVGSSLVFSVAVAQ